MEFLKRAPGFDWLVVLCLLLVGGMSLLGIASGAPELVTHQLFFWLVGLVVFVSMSYLDWELVLLFAPWFYWVSVAGLGLTLILGFVSRGSVRWVDLGWVTLQPSELVKPLLILAWASDLAGSLKFREWLVWWGKVMLVAVLVFIQPDLGSTLVILGIAICMGVASGMRKRGIVVIGMMAVLVLPLGWKMLAPYQQERLVDWFSPWVDPQGGGYHGLQAMIAVGSGEILGKGLGGGTQVHLAFLPERHTDFIFSTLGEEFGFVGLGLLLGVFGVLLWRVLFFAARRREGRYLMIMGVFAYIFVQLVMNTLMNLGWLPVTGITLPLVSYGGSSLISVLFGLGLAQAAFRSGES